MLWRDDRFRPMLANPDLLLGGRRKSHFGTLCACANCMATSRVEFTRKRALHANCVRARHRSLSPRNWARISWPDAVAAILMAWARSAADHAPPNVRKSVRI